ncbi:FAD-dependent oxidoreductase [Nocardioides humi]|uniref:FAD-dependent oxidoreductase n=1 Tax=Nocardioides humi TaxID=449461 RepID=A0ABN1ZWB6_9ACTN
MRLLVLGASLGGLRTAQAVRRAGLDAEVTLVGAEAVLPYDRPPLSKDFLRGARQASDLALASQDELDELGVSLRLGRTATALDSVRQVVDLDDGSALEYDALVIATGSRPRTLPGGHVPTDLHTLRTIDDATALRDRLARSSSLAVIGGGFIGSEIASTARGLDIDVTIVEPAGTLMLRALGETIGQHMTHLHLRENVDIKAGVSVERVTDTGGRQLIELSDGATILADTTVVGIGAIPNIDWLQGSGLTLSDGVLCGPDLRAVGTTNVFGIGDVARWLHPRYDRYIRVEHWTSVAEQARVVAANLAGQPTVADALPYVWSDQLGSRLQIAGVVPVDPMVEYAVGQPGTDRFVALLSDASGPQAVVGRGAVRDFLAHRAELG